MLTIPNENSVTPQYWEAVVSVVGSTNPRTIAVAYANPTIPIAVQAAWWQIMGATTARVSVSEL
jgi:hypothetical protein